MRSIDTPQTFPSKMENTLIHLIDSLRSTLKVFEGKTGNDLAAALHDHDSLPNKHIAGLAREAVDLLHQTEQLLEPGPLVLADHFLGSISTAISKRSDLHQFRIHQLQMPLCCS